MNDSMDNLKYKYYMVALEDNHPLDSCCVKSYLDITDEFGKNYLHLDHILDDFMQNLEREK